MDQLSSLGDSGFPSISAGACRSKSCRRAGDRRVRPDRQRACRRSSTLALAFTRLDLTASAFYGEGGVRLLAAPRSAVSPYVEGTAGVAHLRFGVNGLGSTTDALIRAALNLVDTRDPIFGVGGGVLMQGGPLQIDLGYRYKRILAEQRAELDAQRRPGAAVAPGAVWCRREVLTLELEIWRLGDQEIGDLSEDLLIS